MGALKRFEFSTVFDADGAILGGEAAAQFVPRAEVERLTREAHHAGFAEGHAQNERAIASATEALVGATERVLDRLYTDMAEAQAAFGALALSAARLIAGAALEAFGPAQATALLDRALASASTAPRLTIRARPDVIERIHGPLTDAAAQRGFAGALHFEADAQAGGVRIDWGSGALGIDPEAIERALSQALSDRLATGAEEDLA